MLPAYRIFFWLCAAMAWLAGPAWAETLRMATVAMAPYGTLADGAPSGAAHDCAEAVARTAGYDCEIRILSLDRIVRGLESGTLDAAITFSGRELDRVALVVGVVVDVRVVVVPRRDIRLRAVRDLRGKRVALLRHADDGGLLNPAHGVVPVRVASLEQGLKLLLARRVHGVAGPEAALALAVTAIGRPARSFGTPLAVPGQPLTLYVSSQLDDAVRGDLAGAFEKLRQEGDLQTIFGKYSL